MIRRYLRRTTFVPSTFVSMNFEGRGGLLSFGVNLRVPGFLSVHAFVGFRAKCTLITSLSEFISVFKQPTLSVVFRRFKYHQLKFTFIVQIFLQKKYHHQLPTISSTGLLVMPPSQLVVWRLRLPFFRM